MEGLRSLIREQVNKIGSAREFARKAGINHQFVNDALNGNEIKPEITTLIKISEYTGYELESIVGLAYPDVASQTRLSPEARLLAQRIERLPANIREVILRLVTGEVNGDV